MKNIFFNSSMPRSCSTLLQNIFNQNPEVYATPTDGSLELLYGARMNYTNSPEFKAQDSELMLKAWRGFCYHGLQGYAEYLTNKPNVCIKSRGIGIHLPWYNAFFEQCDNKKPKVIAMVRNLKSIISSMEKIYRANQENHQAIQNHAQMTGTTTEKRMEIWLNSQPIGLALERFYQIIQEGLDKQILFIRAEDLTDNPDKIMRAVYEYLGLPVFNHDFDKIEQATEEDDTVYGISQTLHKIRPKVELLKPDYYEVLGRNLCKNIDEKVNWYQKTFKYI